ncbi:LmeA family phospholipid-binding protein [Kribbella sp. NPDC055071]
MSSRKPRHWGRRLIVTVVVLGVLLVAIDRAAAWVAENQLTTMAEKEAAKYDVTSSDTSVKIGGFGFLPQLAKERFSKVTLTMKQPTLDAVPAEDLKVDLSGVHVPRGLITGDPGTAVTVDTTDVRLQLSPAELAKQAARSTGLTGLTMNVLGDKLQAKLTVRGVTADATVRPQILKGRIVLVVDQLSDNIPSFLQSTVKSQLSKGITLPKLPFGATLKTVSIEGSSVILTATAADLKIAG